MSVQDLIADQLTVIRNAIQSKKEDVTIKRSGVLEGVARIMKEEGFIDNYSVIDDKKQGKIKIYLKYRDTGASFIEDIKRVSTSGRRYYVPADEVKPVMGGVGVAIVSTSSGLITDKAAREKKVGGEIICKIW